MNEAFKCKMDGCMLDGNLLFGFARYTYEYGECTSEGSFAGGQ